MSHLGFLSFPGTGHLNPLAALGRRLQRRGHLITVFQVADLEPTVRAAGLNFVQIGRNQFPRGTLRELDQKLSRLSGFAAVRYLAKRILAGTHMTLEDAPGAMVDARIDALVVDEAELAGGTIANYLNLPFVNVALALPIHLESGVSFFAFNWRHEASPLHRIRNQLGNLFIEHLASTGRTAINRYRGRWRLPPICRTNDFRGSPGLPRCLSNLIFQAGDYRLVSATPARSLMLEGGSLLIFHGTAFRQTAR